MSFTSIQDCLSHNAEVLGKDYSQLGTSVKSGWFNHRVFLSFDSKQGWNVVKLNWLQLFLRNFFGFYKSTHLVTVAHAWKDCTKQTSYRNAALDERIQALRFSPKRFFSSWGNTDSSKADLFLFPEWHTHKKYRKTVNRYINQQYREGDVVLVEGAAAGTAVKEYHQQVKQLKKGIPVYGWEPKNFKDLIATPNIRKYEEMVEELEFFTTKFMSMKYDFEAIGSRLGKIISEIQKLGAYFDPTMPPEQIEANIKTYYEKSKKAHDPRGCFQAIIIMVLMEYEKKQEKALYSHTGPDDVKKLVKTIHERNLSLVAEIQKYRAQGKRVFVIAGASHLLCWPFAAAPTVPQEVHSCIKDHKFVVLADKKIMRHKVMAANKDFFSHLNKVEP